MAKPKHSIGGHQHSVAANIEDEHAVACAAEMRRLRRLAALKHVAGIWANRADIPADGLEYQREIWGIPAPAG
jgi:hypothetical protein